MRISSRSALKEWKSSSIIHPLHFSYFPYVDFLFYFFKVDESMHPLYYKQIRKPVDLTTIQRRLKRGVYINDLEILTEDIRLIFKNCYQYNMDDSLATKQAKKLETFYENELYFELRRKLRALKQGIVAGGGISPTRLEPSLVPAKTMEESIKKICAKLLRRLDSQEGISWFRNPVDPFAQGIPDYIWIIERPMDMSTVKKKLADTLYENPEEFKSDLLLIFRNALVFNLIESPIFQDAGRLSKYVKSKYSEYFPSIAEPSPISLDELENRKVENTLRYLESLPEIREFRYRVNPNVVPGYYLKIENPINLGTIKAKWAMGEFPDASAFVSDMDLLFRNCLEYNRSPDLLIHQQCLSLQKLFKEKWSEPISHVASEDFTVTAVGQLCSTLLSRIINHPGSLVFREPVDHVALNIPQYPEIVKNPMDFSTIQRKLPGYRDATQFLDDVRLIFDNCFLFNPPGKHSLTCCFYTLR